MTARRQKLMITITAAQWLLTLILFWLQKDIGIVCRSVTIGCVFLSVTGSIVLYNGYYDKNEDWNTLLSAYRLSRHDFQNHLQVLYSMAQLGKREQAINYVCSIRTVNDSIGTICNLEDRQTLSFMLDLFFYFKQRHISAIIEAPGDIYIAPGNLKSLWRRIQEYALDLDSAQDPKEIKFVFEDDHVDILSVLGQKRITLTSSIYPYIKVKTLLKKKSKDASLSYIKR